jgi:uncharacterized membrane-anchored protein YitT (DUF2179 family)
MITKKSEIKKNVSDLFLAAIGIASASIGLKAFLLPNQFFDGGVTGVSLLINQLTGFNISFAILLINIPFLLLGIKHISKPFAIRSFITILALAVAVHFIHWQPLTDDKLLIAVFGGLFLGAGIGFSVRGGTVIDGTEILAIYLSKKFRTTIGTIILMFNIILFIVAALLTNIEIALYSILTYITASRAADYIIHGIEEYIGFSIISDKSEEIRKAITEETGYGATIYKGKSGYRKNGMPEKNIDIIHTVITRLEINKLHRVIERIDSTAFIIEYPINDAKGGIIKKKKNL